MPEEVTNEQQVIEEQPQDNGEGNEPEAVLTSEEPQESGLPDEASERTKREFEKLKEHNRKLAEENKALKGGEKPKPSLLDEYMGGSFMAPSVQPQMMQMPQLPNFDNLSQAKVEEVKQNLIDEQGYLDAQELEKRLGRANEAERRAQLAEQKAERALERVARFEIDAQKKQLYAAFPELDPSSNQFSPDAYQLVKNKMLEQLVETGEQRPLEAAQDMERYFRKAQIPQAKQQAMQARTQAMSVGTPGKAGSTSSAEYDELRKRSMTDDAAMDERIRRAGI